MSWIIDPNFGSTHKAYDAFSPFTTGGGNKVLNIGAGVIYRSDFSEADVSMRATLVYQTTSGDFATFGPSLIVRRQANGSFYVASHLNHHADNIGLEARIQRYHGPTDTFFSLSFVTTPDTLGILTNTLLTMTFEINIDSMTTTIINSSGQTLISASAIDSNITSAGNPGIAGNIVNTSSTKHCTASIDDLSIRKI
jgi:hypothetical protein